MSTAEIIGRALNEAKLGPYMIPDEWWNELKRKEPEIAESEIIYASDVLWGWYTAEFKDGSVLMYALGKVDSWIWQSGARE